MRAITKIGHGGYHLTQANTNPPQTHKQATSRWSSFGHKPALMLGILNEQYHLCCYSELSADQEGLGYHIEHVENKSQNPQRTFDYSNLAASALESVHDLPTFNAQGHEVFGGHAPAKQDSRRFFAYLSDGRVIPASALNIQEQDRAQYTIDTLNLNSPYLLTRRRQWWDELDGLFQEHTAKGWSLTDLAAIDLVPTNNRLSRFFSLTRQFFGQIAEDALYQHAPGLV
jgi:uncharacterized protein (TIGR02646 family)